MFTVEVNDMNTVQEEFILYFKLINNLRISLAAT